MEGLQGELDRFCKVKGQGELDGFGEMDAQGELG